MKGGVRKKRTHTQLFKLSLCTWVNYIVTPTASSQRKFWTCRAVKPPSALKGPGGVTAVIMPDW